MEQEVCCHKIILIGEVIRHSTITENCPERLLNGYPEVSIGGFIELYKRVPDYYHDDRCLIIKTGIQETISFLKKQCSEKV